VHYISPSIARSELRSLAHGKRSRIPVKILAEYVLNYCSQPAQPSTPKPRPQDDSVQFLERLYALEDPRAN
jgi:hypothetical protein